MHGQQEGGEGGEKARTTGVPAGEEGTDNRSAGGGRRGREGTDKSAGGGKKAWKKIVLTAGLEKSTRIVEEELFRTSYF